MLKGEYFGTIVEVGGAELLLLGFEGECEEDGEGEVDFGGLVAFGGRLA